MENSSIIFEIAVSILLSVALVLMAWKILFILYKTCVTISKASRDHIEG